MLKIFKDETGSRIKDLEYQLSLTLDSSKKIADLMETIQERDDRINEYISENEALKSEVYVSERRVASF